MSCSPNLFPLPTKEENIVQENSSPEQNIPKENTDNISSPIGSNVEPTDVDGHNSRKASAEPASQEGVHIVPITIQAEEEPSNTKGRQCEKKEETKPSDPALDKLQKVKDAVAELVEKIESYEGSKEDKEYKYLDEMLTRHLCTLDSIEANGRDDIRQMRKETIRSINRCASILDARASGKIDNADDKNANDNNAVLDELVAISNK